jgi:hypothetical protein
MTSEIHQKSIPDKPQTQENKFVMPIVVITKLTPLELFLGQYFEKRKDLNDQLDSIEKILSNFDPKNSYLTQFILALKILLHTAWNIHPPCHLQYSTMRIRRRGQLPS